LETPRGENIMQSVVGSVVVLVIAAVIIFLLFSIHSAKERQRQEAQSRIEQLESVAGDLSKLPDLSDQVKGLILRSGERCFALCRGAQHVVEAHRTKYVGGSHGVSFRISQGIRYHEGALSGHPVRTAYEKVGDMLN
jgi:hypothetical protein